jgi:hypothetical protein
MVDEAMSDRATAARALNRLGYAADRAIDRLTAPLAEAVAASVRRHAVTGANGTQVLSPLGYRLVMRDVDRLLRRIYGDRQGDTTAPMYRTIAQAAEAAHEEPIDRTIADMRRRLEGERELRAMLEGDPT